MKVLCVIPPHVPSYFNAGHRLPMFQVAHHLRGLGHAVVCRDFGALNATWRDVCALLVQRFDVVAVCNDFDAVDGIERLLDYTRELCPAARTITFGRGSRHVPALFERFGLDAIAVAGDYETAVAAYLDHLGGECRPDGVRLRDGERYLDAGPGRMLDDDELVLPDIDDIPYEAYDRLYADDLNKFCGIPGRRELVVPVARGCPVGCSFCDVPVQQGLKERRVSVERVIRYVEACWARHPFDYVSFYAPTFTLKRRWVVDLCTGLRDADLDLRWKCVTTLGHLDPDLIATMAACGCVRISVGVETLSRAGERSLPTFKARSNGALDEIAETCAASGVELNCFVMIGLPGEAVSDAEAGVTWLLERGHRVRPTVFTPYDRMPAEVTLRDYGRFNRQLLVHTDLDRSQRDKAYRLLYANADDRPTRVAERIPGVR